MTQVDPTPAEHPQTVEGRPRKPALRQRLLDAIEGELDRAYATHGAEPWGRHEFYGILKEEVDEMWDDIKGDAPLNDVAKEAIQVAAMCIRYIETGDRYQGDIGWWMEPEVAR